MSTPPPPSYEVAVGLARDDRNIPQLPKDTDRSQIGRQQGSSSAPDEESPMLSRVNESNQQSGGCLASMCRNKRCVFILALILIIVFTFRTKITNTVCNAARVRSDRIECDVDPDYTMYSDYESSYHTEANVPRSKSIFESIWCSEMCYGARYDYKKTLTDYQYDYQYDPNY